MPKLIDLTGKVFGRVKVIKRFSEYTNGSIKWLCVCECGKEFVTRGESLKRGTTKSCGCLSREFTSNLRKTHGMTKTRIFNTWGHMINRCTSETHNQYKDYGGRGIKVCDEWFEFVNFHKWALSNGYDDKLTIDRIDVNGNYEPNNCRWADSYTQQNNTRRTIKVTINGVTKTLSDWSKETGICKGTLSTRYYKGIRGTKLIEPARKYG